MEVCHREEVHFRRSNPHDLLAVLLLLNIILMGGRHALCRALAMTGGVWPDLVCHREEGHFRRSDPCELLAVLLIVNISFVGDRHALCRALAMTGGVWPVLARHREEVHFRRRDLRELVVGTFFTEYYFRGRSPRALPSARDDG